MAGVDNMIHIVSNSLFLSTSILLLALVSVQVQVFHDGACTSSNCKKEAVSFAKSYDPKAFPCENFHQYACGSFMKTAKSKSSPVVSQVERLIHQAKEVLRDELTSFVWDNDTPSFKIMKKFYLQCTEEVPPTDAFSYDPRKDYDKIKEVVERLGGWTLMNKITSFTPWQEILPLQIEMGFPADFPFEVEMILDPEDESRRIIVMTPLTYLYKTNTTKEDVIISITDVLLFSSYEDSSPIEQLTKITQIVDMVELEEKLFAAYNEATQNVTARYRVQDLHLTFPGVSWLKLLKALFEPKNLTVSSGDIVLVNNPEIIVKTLNFVQENPIAASNYMIWRNVYLLINYRDIYASPSVDLRNEVCLDFLLEQIALNAYYIKKYIDLPGRIEGATQLYHNIFKEAGEYFDETYGLMLQSTKNLLENTTLMLGYPENMPCLDVINQRYEWAHGNPKNAIDYYLIVMKAEAMLRQDMLLNPSSGSQRFKTVNAMIDSSYDHEKDLIIVPALYLQPPFYEKNRPQYLNYGGLGFVFAFTISRAFYARFNEYREQMNHTLVDIALKIMLIDSACLKHSYDNYLETKLGLPMFGDSSMSGYMSETSALRIAYRAYQRYQTNLPEKEKVIPHFSHMNPNQLFWMSAARAMCVYHEERTINASVALGIHKPGETRINIGFANLEEFSKAFDCPKGSAMNPINRCTANNNRFLS